MPVVKGATDPLLNTRREQELREALYGSHPTWHGAFNPDTPPPERTWPPPGGFPKTKPRPGRAADFIIDTIRAHPGEVVLYFAGPLTNLALAVRMDPGIVPLTKALYVMGASNKGGFELNWWWDPEAAAIVMREPWKEIVVTPAETGFQPYTSEALMRRVVKAGGRLARHVQEVYLDTQAPAGLTHWSAMWDEVLAAALVDPSVIRKSETLYLDADITHGPKYGHTVVWRPPDGVPSFFEAYSGPEPPDPEKWKGHLARPSTCIPPPSTWRWTSPGSSRFRGPDEPAGPRPWRDRRLRARDRGTAGALDGDEGGQGAVIASRHVTSYQSRKAGRRPRPEIAARPAEAQRHAACATTAAGIARSPQENRQ